MRSSLASCTRWPWNFSISQRIIEVTTDLYNFSGSWAPFHFRWHCCEYTFANETIHHTNPVTALVHNITKYTNIVKWLGSLFCSWSSIFLVDCSVTYPSCSDRTLMSSLVWHIHLLWHVPVLWCSTTHVYLICLFCQGSWCYCDHTRPDTQPSGGTTKAARACPQLRRRTHWTARGEYQTYSWREERNGSGIMLLYMIWMVHATSGVLFTSLLSNEGLSLGTWTPAFTQPSRKFIGRQLFT